MPVIRLGGVDQLLTVLLLDLPAGDRQRKRARADLPVLGDPDRGMRGDVVDPLGVGEEGIDSLRRAGAPRARLILPDDVDLLSRVAAEALLGEVAGGLRLRSRRV